MRPRVMSYGVISTWTLSPGRMRIRCIRIFPELCARTVYPFSNSTRNMALGKGSTTVPSTVNASSFGLLRFFLLVSSLRGAREQTPSQIDLGVLPRGRLSILPENPKNAKSQGLSSVQGSRKGDNNAFTSLMGERKQRSTGSVCDLYRVVDESLEDELFEAFQALRRDAGRLHPGARAPE